MRRATDDDVSPSQPISSADLWLQRKSGVITGDTGVRVTLFL